MKFYILRICFSTPTSKIYNSEILSMAVREFMKYLFIGTLIVFYDFFISWSLNFFTLNSLNLF